MTKPVVVNFDMAQSGRIKPDPDELEALVHACLAIVGTSTTDKLAGDGCALVIPSSYQADGFAELLHSKSHARNVSSRHMNDYWCFRVGISHAQIHTLDSGRWGGESFVVAARLQEQCKPGEILVDEPTLSGLPESRQSLYHGIERISPKPHEPLDIKAHRRRVVPLPSWEHEWKSDAEELKSEFGIALAAIQQIRPHLDCLFRNGDATRSAAMHTALPSRHSQVVTTIGFQFADQVCRFLSSCSKFCTVIDALEPATTRAVDNCSDKYIWVVDALDGARHVLRALPFFASTLALVERSSGEAVVGVTYVPWTQEMFMAIRGGGAFRNDWNHRLDMIANPRAEELDRTVYIEFPQGGSKSLPQECEVLSKVLKQFNRARGMALGSFALAYVAKGTFEAYVDFSHTSRIHNMAAGCLFVREAGGEVVTFSNGLTEPWHRCLAGTKETVGALRPIIEVSG